MNKGFRELLKDQPPTRKLTLKEIKQYLHTLFSPSKGRTKKTVKEGTKTIHFAQNAPARLLYEYPVRRLDLDVVYYEVISKNTPNMNSNPDLPEYESDEWKEFIKTAHEEQEMVENWIRTPEEQKEIDSMYTAPSNQEDSNYYKSAIAEDNDD